MLDIFRGFVRNYNAIKLEWADGEYTSTKYTNLILNYFLRVGEALGFECVLEGKKRDLVWARNKTESAVMHLEHENSSDLAKVKGSELIQLANSDAMCVIGLFYPSSKGEIDKWTSAVEEKLNMPKEMLIILNPLQYESKSTMELHGLIRNQTRSPTIKHYVAEFSYPIDPASTIVLVK